MKILIFHPSLLPPKNYGGTERVVLWLTKGLVELGHEVWVGAYEGSILPAGAKLLVIDPRKNSAKDLKDMKVPNGVELIHFMAPLSHQEWEGLRHPAVVTVHGNGKSGERFPKNTVFLSQDHARRHGGTAYIYNGIDPAEYRFEPQLKEDWFLFLSKTSWRVKNLEGAIRICRKAKVPLRIAGGSRPYLTHLKTLLMPGLQWLGPVNGARKAQYLARARALIFPVLWPEPFGLVVAEALVSGTPVLGTRHGSLPELVPSDVGALLGDSEDVDGEWLGLLKTGDLKWDPARCRDWALRKFHYKRMAEDYERVYRRVIAGEYLNQDHPVGRDWRNP